MTSQFLALAPPPGSLLDSYDRTTPPAAQSKGDIPQPFLDAMSVREAVFVHEQHVPLENEYDADDARSWHWVAHVSVASKGAPEQTDSKGRRTSAANVQLPVGTIRLVPPPHPPHPQPGSSHAIDNSEDAPRTTPADDTVPEHTPNTPLPLDIAANEPYIKLGRLAVLAPYRKLGMGRMLVEEACSWAAAHADDILRSENAVEAEETKVGETVGRWKGLVLVHAQKWAEKVYERWGFKRDEALGVWDEEGVDHVGMWKRVTVK